MTLDLGVLTGSLSQAAGGLFESVRLPANRLAQEGANVSVYGLYDDLLESSRSAWQGPRLEAFEIAGPQRLGFSPGMLKRVQTANHQILHLHGIWFFPSFVLESWRRRTRKPTVISPRGMLDPWALRNSRLKKLALEILYEGRNLKGATALHALNEDEANSIRRFGLSAPVAVIPNGINLPDLAGVIPKPDWLVADERKALLFLGRLHPKKGLIELLAAWKKLEHKAPAIWDSWRLIIAGWDDGGHRSELEERVVEHGLGSHVAFIGPLHGAHKHAALRHVSAFVLPSHSEGMPMAVLEAWSYRLPVFMTKACNLSHSFAAGAAIAIESDPDSMCDTLAVYLDDETKLNSIADAGEVLVTQSYTWDRVVGDMRVLYQWMIGGGSQPGFIR